MRNIRLVIAYDGTDFHGWQRQPSQPTVQECLEVAIAKIANEKVTVWGSGRTDAGVHAANQVANFKTACPIPLGNLVKALNHLLPASVRVKEAHAVDASFHARYGARSKTYRYRILQSAVASPFIARFVYHYPYHLNQRRMAEAAKFLEGMHDFTSFAARSSHEEESAQGSVTQEKGESDKVRTLFVSRILSRSRPPILNYEVRGSGFLHHMVRNIVGTLVEVGRGEIEPQRIVRILEARDRRQAGPTAPAQGLCLWKVEY